MAAALPLAHQLPEDSTVFRLELQVCYLLPQLERPVDGCPTGGTGVVIYEIIEIYAMPA